VVSKLPTVLELAEASVSLAKFCARVCRKLCNEVAETLELESELLLALLEPLLAAANKFWKSVCKVASAPPPFGAPPLLALSDVSELLELPALMGPSICCNSEAKLELELSYCELLVPLAAVVALAVLALLDAAVVLA